MIDPANIAIIVGVATLLIERAYKLLKNIKKSNCCGASIETRQSNDDENSVDPKTP